MGGSDVGSVRDDARLAPPALVTEVSRRRSASVKDTLFSGAWCAMMECWSDLAGAAGELQRSFVGDALGAANGCGAVATCTSVAVYQHAYPIMWKLAFAKTQTVGLGLALTLGITGIMAFGASQLVLVSCVADWLPKKGSGRDRVVRWTVAVYGLATVVPPVTHLALQHAAAWHFLNVDFWCLAFSCFKLSFTLERQFKLALRAPQQPRHRRGALGRGVQQLCARLTGAGESGAAAVAISGTRTCAGAVCFWALCVVPKFP